MIFFLLGLGGGPPVGAGGEGWFPPSTVLGQGWWVNEPWVGENGAQAKQLQPCSFCSLLRPFGVYVRYIQGDQRLSPDQQVWLRPPPPKTLLHTLSA